MYSCINRKKYITKSGSIQTYVLKISLNISQFLLKFSSSSCKLCTYFSSSKKLRPVLFNSLQINRLECFALCVFSSLSILSLH